jgi:hypothetical protein
MFGDRDTINKALVSLVIENALLDLGKPVYEKFAEILFKKYRCYLTDCYEHPEYFHAVIEEFFGNSSNAIIESIKKNLEENATHKQVAKFLEVISKQP